MSVGGAVSDLEYLRLALSPGPPEVCQITDITGQLRTAIFNDQLNDIEDLAQARDEADRIVNVLSGLLFAQEPGRETLHALGVLEQTAPDEWMMHQHVRVGTLHIVPRAARMMGAERHDFFVRLLPWALSVNDDRVVDVIEALRGHPDWFELWKAHEIIKRDREPLKQAGAEWPEERSRLFEDSATLHRHAPHSVKGESARRHLQGSQPLPIGEARVFVARLAKVWFEWRATAGA